MVTHVLSCIFKLVITIVFVKSQVQFEVAQDYEDEDVMQMGSDSSQKVVLFLINY